MSWSAPAIWGIILGLALGTFVIRLSFLGLIGDRRLPEWLLRHLRYTPVAVMPALIAPLVVWPEATGGMADPPRMAAAVAAVALGLGTRNVLVTIGGGMAVLYLALALTG